MGSASEAKKKKRRQELGVIFTILMKVYRSVSRKNFKCFGVSR
jgi:hypothetical protein